MRTISGCEFRGRRDGAAIVVCPGGGYGGLASHEGPVVAKWLAEYGVAGFVLRYRLGPKYHYPAEIEDGQRAVRFVRAHAHDSQLLHQALQRKGNRSELVVVPGLGHCRIVLTLSRPDRTSAAAILRFIAASQDASLSAPQSEEFSEECVIAEQDDERISAM